jgi:carbonic anhydrase
MCQNCDSKSIELQNRRSFLKYASLGIGAALTTAAWPVLAAAKSPPKPENVISPDEALARLIAGNQRYVANTPLPTDFASTRAALATGQNPYACVLSCADSRISPELCFDSERGDLFVTRVAGNYVTPAILASLEYGTAVLQSPLIMVLGHTSCGAINAAIKAVQKDEDFPGHIQQLTTDLSPAVTAAMKTKPANLELASIRENVRLNVDKLKNSTPLLRRRVQNQQLKVVGGIYHLETGRVEIITPT